MGHLCWKSDRVYYLFTFELYSQYKKKAVILHLINPPLWNTPSGCSRSLSPFLCIWTQQRFGRWTVCLPGPGLFCSVQGRGRGRKGMWASPAAAPRGGFVWIQVCLCLTLGSFPYVSSAVPLWSPVALALVFNKPFLSFFGINIFFFTHKVAVQVKGTSVQGNNRTGDMQCCFSEIVLAGLLLDNLIR